MKHISIRNLFVNLLVMAVLLSCKSSTDNTKNINSGKQPNIIFIFADDWGYGDLGIHGSTFVETPNLDKMASEGIDFQNFTVNNPVCSPSRVAVMTGHYPARYAVHRHFSRVEHNMDNGMPDWLNPNAPMLPKLLKEAGYKTGHFGKWHLADSRASDAPLPTSYGIDEYASFNVPGKEKISYEESVPRALDFIKKNRDTTFFMNVWIHETHTPFYPREEYLEKYKNLDERKQVYASIIAEGDAGVGAILNVLKDLNIDDNTLVIFSSDNGPEYARLDTDQFLNKGYGEYYSVGETGGLKGEKRSLYAGGIRVPFIVRWPGVAPKGKRDSTSVVTAIDLLPTFLEIAGLELPNNYKPDGQSALAAIKGEDFKRTKPIYWEWEGPKLRESIWPKHGIHDGRWKLITNQDLGRTELYDLESDWAETVDVSSEHPDIVEQLLKKVYAWEKTLPLEPNANCISVDRKK